MSVTLWTSDGFTFAGSVLVTIAVVMWIVGVVAIVHALWKDPR